MPYFTCPSCRLSHYSPTVRALDRTCPRCTGTEGNPVELVVSETLVAARALAFGRAEPHVTERIGPTD